VKAIEYLVEYSVSSSELQEIPEDQKSILAVISYAVTEVNSLRKLYLASDHEAQGIGVIDEMISHQRNMLLRLWSAKLFEFSEFIELEKVKPKIMDEDVIAFAATVKAGFAALSIGSGYEAARNIRHEATSHYLFSAARKNLPYLDKKASLRLFLHAMTGNAFYPWGDTVMFFGRIARQGRKLATDADKRRLIEEWMDWNLSATKWMDGVAEAAFRSFVLAKFPDKAGRRRDYWIDPVLVATTGERRSPIILRKSSQ
jgi:hypothetical protein